MRPNACRHKCFRDVVKEASSHPTYQHSSLHCVYRDRSMHRSVGVHAGADSRHCFSSEMRACVCVFVCVSVSVCVATASCREM